MSRWQGLSANTEVFSNACVSIAAYLLYGASRASSKALSSAAAAAVLGIGLQIIYVVFPEAVLFRLAYLIAVCQRNRDSRAVVATAGLLILAGCFPTGIVILYFWAHGTLQPFLDANIALNIAYIQITPSLFDVIKHSASGIAPIIGPILMIGYAMACRIRWCRMWNTAASIQVGILLWSAAAIADVCLPIKFSIHYFFALYPPLCLAGALTLSAVAGSRSMNSIVGLVVLFITAVPLWGLGEAWAARAEKSDAPPAIAAFLRQCGAHDMNAFVYDYDPVVYALAHIRPPIPYILGDELVQFSYSSRIDGVTEIQHVTNLLREFVIVRVLLRGEPAPDHLDATIARRLVDYHIVFQTLNEIDSSEIRIYARQ